MTKVSNPQFAALFDLDGVLIDSEGIYTQFWAEIDRRFPTGVENFALVIKGNTLARILDTYFPDEVVRKAIYAELARHEREMVYRLFPGAERFLRELQSAGIPIAIVTSSNRIKMNHLFAELPSLAEVVDVVLTDEDVSRSKPDPEGYRKAAARFGVASERSVVFEDSLAGIEAGRRAGGRVVAIATTNPRDVLEGRGDMIVDTIDDLSLAAVSALFD